MQGGEQAQSPSRKRYSPPSPQTDPGQEGSCCQPLLVAPVGQILSTGTTQSLMGCFKLKSGRAASEAKYFQSLNANRVWLEVEGHWGSKAAGAAGEGEGKEIGKASE